MTRPARGEPVGQARRHRADAGDRHDAERNAGDENAEAAQSAAQLAPGKTQRQQRHACRAICGGRNAHGAITSRRCVAGSQPHDRSQRAARAESCVTSTSVVPCSRWPRNNRSMICTPVVLVEIAGRLVGDQDGWDWARARAQARRVAARRRKVRLDNGAVCRRDRPPSSSRWRAQTRRARRQVQAARRRFPAPSWSG